MGYFNDLMTPLLHPHSSDATDLSPQEKQQLSQPQQLQAMRFGASDVGWIILSIGMAIGAGIVFLPVQVGIVGVWSFLASAVVAYPALLPLPEALY